MRLRTGLWTAAALLLVVPAQVAMAQLERDIIERGYVITSEDPNVYYDFGDEGWRTKARAANEREREMRNGAPSQEERMEAAPQDEKLLTNVKASEREPVEGASSVIYRDVGNPDPGEEGGQNSSNQPSQSGQESAQANSESPRSTASNGSSRYERGTAPDGGVEQENSAGTPTCYNYWDIDGDGDIDRVPEGGMTRQPDSPDVLERGERAIGGTDGYIERHDDYVDDNTVQPPRLRFDADQRTDWEESPRDRGIAPEAGVPATPAGEEGSTAGAVSPSAADEYESDDFVVEDPADLDAADANVSTDHVPETGSQ